MTKEDLDVDARVHSRLIGSKGRNIRKIMDQYKVDIKFARSNENPNVITVMGQPENVEECKDYLLNVVEEYVRVSGFFTSSQDLSYLWSP